MDLAKNVLGAESSPWAARDGSPFPQGVSWVESEQAFNFAIYSKHAERVTLLLYGEDDLVNPLAERRLDYLSHKSGRIWHCRVPLDCARQARYYAYSMDGPMPSGPFEWHAFDPGKVLLDPCARAIFFPPGFDRVAAQRPGSNAGKAPLGVLHARDLPRAALPDRRRHEADCIIYELHVRGFTMDASSGVPYGRRGTFLGLIDKIPYLQELGITVVELMPIFQYDPQEGSYWGYMPLSFFAPHDGYACTKEPEKRLDEVRDTVSAFHDAGIEVVLDVVYNHTAEGDHRGPTYSFRGIDNSTYYLTTDDPAHPYADYSGTGNTLHTANHYVHKLILDSLRFWVEQTGVDGFRFDLASVFSRLDDGSIAPDDPGIFADIAADPVLSQTRLIAEPWDAATVQLGRSLPGIMWAQWNSRFRDDVRRFLRGDPGMVPSVMLRLYGSDDLFPDDRDHAYHPYQSINFVTSHDGFTLYDLVSYNQRRNWENGEENRDGAEQNYSWNCGWEGDEDLPADIRALRLRQAKNFCCLLMLANGTPMIRAGDEFLQTQRGNNNPYNQDNATSWLDWNRLRENEECSRFFRLMIAFRKAHPSLCRSRFWRGDVRWYGARGAVDLSVDSRCLAVYLDGASEGDSDVYVMINAGSSDERFTIQEGGFERWLRVADTSLPPPDEIREAGKEARLSASSYHVASRSVVVLVR